ncbi:unnamed protein product [Amoebophrya sp. A120]|nr:unnamed protein product [Amoebophrya sp. A120]|eukprot:GSA120T00021493001.1
MSAQQEPDPLPFDLPATLDEVSPGLLTRVLHHAGVLPSTATVRSFEMRKLGRDRGLLGDKAVLEKVEYDGAVVFAGEASGGQEEENQTKTTTSCCGRASSSSRGATTSTAVSAARPGAVPLPPAVAASSPPPPASFFVKMFPSDLNVPVQSAKMMWTSEVRFINTVLLAANVDFSGREGVDFPTPKFYFAAGPQEEDGKQPLPPPDGASPTPFSTPRFLILMEPILGEGIRNGDHLSTTPSTAGPGPSPSSTILTKVLPLPHAYRAAKDLAALQAPFFGWSYERYKADERTKLLPHLSDPNRVEMMKGFLQNVMKAGVEMFGKSKGVNAVLGRGRDSRLDLFAEADCTSEDEQMNKAAASGSPSSSKSRKTVVYDSYLRGFREYWLWFEEKIWNPMLAPPAPEVGEQGQSQHGVDESPGGANNRPKNSSYWDAFFEKWKSIPVTLWHGDFHAENMFYNERKESNVYIDFQNVQLQPGVRDLACLLGTGLTREDRRNEEEKIVRSYHDELVRRWAAEDIFQASSRNTNLQVEKQESKSVAAPPLSSPPDYSWKQCWEDYKLMKFDCVFRASMISMFMAKAVRERTGIFADDFLAMLVPLDGSGDADAADVIEDRDIFIRENDKNEHVREQRKFNAVMMRIVEDLKDAEWDKILKDVVTSAQGA